MAAPKAGRDSQVRGGKYRCARAIEIEHLGEKQVVQDLYALTRALLHLGDCIAWLSLLRALEFDTVIVPGLDRGPSGGDPPLLLFKELVRPPDKGGSEPPASGGLLLAPIKATGSDKDPAYSYLRDLHAEAEDTEASRLLYVAATRAERRLHLLACVKCDDHGDPKPPSAHTLLARAWPVAEEFFSEAPAEPAREAPEPEAIYSINRLAPDFRIPPVPARARWTAPPEGRGEEEIEFSWAGETARHVGTVIHRWLQRIAEDELRGWDAARVSSLKETFARELERRGVAPEEVKASAVYECATFLA